MDTPETLYEKQEDGTLKPVKYPTHIVKRFHIYLWLKNYNFNLEEIKFIWDGYSTE